MKTFLYLKPEFSLLITISQIAVNMMFSGEIDKLDKLCYNKIYSKLDNGRGAETDYLV